MKKKSVLGILIALATLAGGLVYLNRQKAQTPLAQISKTSISNRKLFKGKRKSSLIRETASACEVLRSKLEEIDFEMKEVIPRETVEACTQDSYLSRIKLLIDSCYGKDTSDCEANQMFLRALLRTEGITDSDDREMIADLMLREFSKKEPDFKLLTKLAKKLLRDDPKNPAFQKMWAMSKFISQGDPRNQAPELREAIIRELDPEVLNAPDMDGLRMYLETGLDPLKLESLSRSLLQTDPRRPMTREILGWTLWQQGRRDEALSELAIAVKENPKDRWLSQMYQNLQKPEAKKEDYMGRLSLGVRFEDIYN